jgi:DNA polymerase III sliding clamp (beta) subunit (PCNA family)
MEVITRMDGDKVVIKLPNTEDAVLFEEEGLNDYKNIIMPIRMEDENI